MARGLCSSLHDVVMENFEVLRAEFGEVNGHGSALSACLSDVNLLILGLKMTPEIDLWC